jgi:hypothetical protein
LRIASSWLERTGLAAVTRDLVDDTEQRLAVLAFGELFENPAIQRISGTNCTALAEGVNLGTGQLAFGHQIPFEWIADLRRVAIGQKALDISSAFIRQESCMNGRSVQSQATEQTNQHFLHEELFSK